MVEILKQKNDEPQQKIVIESKRNNRFFKA